MCNFSLKSCDEYIISLNYICNICPYCFKTEGAANVTICTGNLERTKTGVCLNNGDVSPFLFQEHRLQSYSFELVFLTNHARQKINAMALLRIIF